MNWQTVYHVITQSKCFINGPGVSFCVVWFIWLGQAGVARQERFLASLAVDWVGVGDSMGDSTLPGLWRLGMPTVDR